MSKLKGEAGASCAPLAKMPDFTFPFVPTLYVMIDISVCCMRKCQSNSQIVLHKNAKRKPLSSWYLSDLKNICDFSQDSANVCLFRQIDTQGTAQQH
jgi:hypothetical protein